ncbi:MAG: hypothetical protein H7067_10095 [Burkholderiales bacterium]|nr:hypothetical protein [Opitutaceae bacterium]
MKTMFGGKFFSAMIGAVALALLTACATPDARIKRNQAIFDALPADRQALIREGKVAIGFTPDEARLALGDPDQRWMRTDAQGSTEIWSYTTYDNAAGVPLYRGYYHRYYGGYPFYYDSLYYRDARPREYFKVGFAGGVVSVIEQEAR